MELFEQIEKRNNLAVRNSYRKRNNSGKTLNSQKVIYFFIVLLLTIIAAEIYTFFELKDMHKISAEKREAFLNERIENRKRIITEEVSKDLKPKPIKNGQERVDNIYRSDEKVAYLTYDDGPAKNITPPILDYLKKEKIPATFFPLGYRIELYPDIVKRMLDEGHFIASHGNSHNYPVIYKNVAATLKDIDLAEESTKKILGKDYKTTLYRFPGGSVGGYYAPVKRAVKKELKKRNIAYVDWNVLTGDSAGNTTVESQFKEFKETKGKKDSLIVLMHDNDDKKATLGTTKKIVELLRAENYTFKNFLDIFKPEEPDIEAEIEKRMNEYLALPSEKIKEIEKDYKAPSKKELKKRKKEEAKKKSSEDKSKNNSEEGKEESQKPNDQQK